LPPSSLGSAFTSSKGNPAKQGAARRPLFEQMKCDAAVRKFSRLLVWKVSRLGRDMREVIATVYELADLGVTVVPIKSQTGAITSTLGKLLWAIQAWYAEMENDERAEAIKAGQARARAGGQQIGRPRRIFDRAQVVTMRDQERLSWPAIARRMGVGVGTVVRAYQDLTHVPEPFQNSPDENL
jgi:putative DNA-invertase from lambdoid prophage Rac